MNINVRLTRIIIVLGLLFSVPACKLVITVPEGGTVESLSGAYSCDAGQTCTIDVVDTFFDESFTARASKNYVFKGWLKKERSFCGNRKDDCALSTTWMDDYPNMLALLASDRKFYLEPVFEAVPVINEDQIVAEGQIYETSQGFDVEGKLRIETDPESSLEFPNARLSLEFNSEGDLLAMNGVTDLPSPLSNFVTTETNIRAEVGLYRGSDLNADPVYEIRLKDERQYLVFLVSEEMDINVYNPVDASRSEKLTIGTPASGKIILIVDPADQMVYRFGESAAVGAYGRAESEQRLLPYEPWITHARFPSFDGNIYETISAGVGIKVFDVLNLSGAQVIHEPGFSDIDWEDPLNSPVAYKAGFNGSVDFAFGVAGFELFSFDIGRASALFSVSPKRGVMKLAGNLEPDVSWQPHWFPVIPQTRLSMDVTADTDGVLVSNISGSYESIIPRADLEGTMRIDPTSVTYAGRIRNQAFDLPVSIRFAGGTTSATVGVTADFSRAVTDGIDGGFEAARKELDRALAELEAALDNLEFEVSLRGVRQLIPDTVDAAISRLDGIPGAVYSTVRNRVIKQINADRVCYVVGCTPSNAKRDQIATDAAKSAKSQAASTIADYKSRLDNLKALAGEADDESLRAGLEAALREVYQYRRFKKTISVRVKVSGLFDKTFKETIDEAVIPEAMATKILYAADNMQHIPAASERVFRGEQLVDSLPDASLVDEIHDRVKAGDFLPPTVTGVTYTVRNGTEYAAGISFSDGSSYTVDFNVLDTDEAIQGIARLLADHLIDLGT